MTDELDKSEVSPETTADKQASPPVAWNWTRSPNGFAEIYSNYVSVTWTLFDVRLRLARLVPTAARVGEDLKGFVLEESAALTVAWPEAKVLRDALDDAVRRYETANGEIKKLKLPE
jgi:hypothetical protein